jgi:hypothetical protein
MGHLTRPAEFDNVSLPVVVPTHHGLERVGGVSSSGGGFGQLLEVGVAHAAAVAHQEGVPSDRILGQFSRGLFGNRRTGRRGNLFASRN